MQMRQSRPEGERRVRGNTPDALASSLLFRPERRAPWGLYQAQEEEEEKEEKEEKEEEAQSIARSKV